MNIKGKYYCMVWVFGDGKVVEIIDQIKLFFKFEVVVFIFVEMVVMVIQDMWVCGVLFIGVVVVYGIVLGMNYDVSDMGLQCYYDFFIKI